MTKLEYLQKKNELTLVASFHDLDFKKGEVFTFELKADEQDEMTLFVYTKTKGIMVNYSLDDKNNLYEIQKVIEMFENENTYYNNDYINLLMELQKQ